MENKELIYVVIWGIDDFNTLGLIRELNSDYFNVLFLLYGKKGIASKSKYCKKIYQTQSLLEGFEFLKSNFNLKRKSVLITSCDNIACFIDDNRDSLEPYFYIPGCSKKGLTRENINKNNMTKTALDIGFNVPKSLLFNKETNVLNINLNYPLALKPSHERDGHYNEFKIKKIKNSSELKKIQKYINKNSEFIIQEYIEKEYDILIYGGRMRDGKTIFAGSIKRERFSLNYSTSKGEIKSEIPQCVSETSMIKYLEKIDFYGLFSFEFGYKDKKAYFYEINLRNDGTSDYFNQAGINIPLLYSLSCIDKNYMKHFFKKIDFDLNYIDEIYDYENVLTKKISKKTYKDDLKKATIFRFKNINDMDPYLYEYRHRKINILKHRILSRFRINIVYILDKIGLRK